MALPLSRVEDAIENAVRDLDEELADYYMLGLATFRYVLLGARPDRAEDLEEAQRLLSKLGHPPMLFKTALGGREAEDDQPKPLEAALSICMRLARDLVLGLSHEEGTCFVAMPFSKPYEDRYLNLYRGLSRRMDKQGFRAWGGILEEEHQELLLAVIAKCGALIADVTAPNANVTLELGFAIGRRIPVYLLAEEARWKPTANIPREWIYLYDADEDADWELEAAEKAGMYFTMLESLKTPAAPFPTWKERPAEVFSAIT